MTAPQIVFTLFITFATVYYSLPFMSGRRQKRKVAVPRKLKVIKPYQLN